MGCVSLDSDVVVCNVLLTDVGLVLDVREGDGCDHHDHEVEARTVSNVYMLVRLRETHIQLADVDRALEGARIRRGTISDGYNQVIPCKALDFVQDSREGIDKRTSQPMAKKVLKTNRKTACPIPAWLSLRCVRR